MAARLSSPPPEASQIEAVVGYVASIIITTEQRQGRQGQGLQRELGIGGDLSVSAYCER